MKNRMIRKHRTQARAGFTLLELLIVLAIIVVIAAMVVPNLIGQRDEAMINTTKSAIANVESALKLYNANRGEYPEGSSDVLEMLTQPQEVDGRKKPPYLESPAMDAWNRPLFYEWPNTKQQDAFKPAIWSAGPDGKNDDGGGDDINNWTVKQAKK